MLNSDSFSGPQHTVQDDNTPDQLDPDTASAVPAKPHSVANTSASPAGDMDTGHTFLPQPDSDADLADLDLPTAPTFPVLPESSQKPSAAVPDTEEALFARLTALKSRADTLTGPAASLDALNDRLSALKGPKAAPADMHDLHSRLDVLKGRDKVPPSLLELEGRFAKLRGSLDPPKGKLVPGNAVPDFDPVVELNEQQLEALANMSDHDPNTTDAMSDELADDSSMSPCNDFTHKLHVPSVMSKAAQQTAAGIPVHATLESTQMIVQDSVEEEELSHEQLLALANMPSSSTAAVPAWAAALGLSAQDLHHDDDAGEAPEAKLASHQGEQCAQEGRTGKSEHQNMPRHRRL